MGWGLLLAIFISFLIFLLLFKFLKRIGPLIVNGCVGIVIFWVLNAFGVIKIPLDLLTFLIPALAGIFGVAIVVLFSALGIPL